MTSRSLHDEFIVFTSYTYDAHSRVIGLARAFQEWRHEFAIGSLDDNAEEVPCRQPSHSLPTIVMLFDFDRGDVMRTSASLIPREPVGEEKNYFYLEYVDRSRSDAILRSERLRKREAVCVFFGDNGHDPLPDIRTDWQDATRNENPVSKDRDATGEQDGSSCAADVATRELRMKFIQQLLDGILPSSPLKGNDRGVTTFEAREQLPGLEKKCFIACLTILPNRIASWSADLRHYLFDSDTPSLRELAAAWGRRCHNALLESDLHETSGALRTEGQAYDCTLRESLDRWAKELDEPHGTVARQPRLPSHSESVLPRRMVCIGGMELHRPTSFASATTGINEAFPVVNTEPDAKEDNPVKYIVTSAVGITPRRESLSWHLRLRARLLSLLRPHNANCTAEDGSWVRALLPPLDHRIASRLLSTRKDCTSFNEAIATYRCPVHRPDIEEGLLSLGGLVNGAHKAWQYFTRADLERDAYSALKNSFRNPATTEQAVQWAIHLAGSNGLTVIFDQHEEVPACLIRIKEKKVAFIYEGLDSPQRTWAICHETAHEVLGHHVASCLQLDMEDTGMENQAEAMASLWCHFFGLNISAIHVSRPCNVLT